MISWAIFIFTSAVQRFVYDMPKVVAIFGGTFLRLNGGVNHQGVV